MMDECDVFQVISKVSLGFKLVDHLSRTKVNSKSSLSAS
jgi:hypothetical protein